MTAEPSNRRRILVFAAVLLTLALLLAALIAVGLCLTPRGGEAGEDDMENPRPIVRQFTRLKVGLQFLWYDTKFAIERKLAGESVEIPPPTVEAREESESTAPEDSGVPPDGADTLPSDPPAQE